ncbi:MAG: hypothetical protein WAM71_22015, partial [Candidatus Korobacteraceae bacterium]
PKYSSWRHARMKFKCKYENHQANTGNCAQTDTAYASAHEDAHQNNEQFQPNHHGTAFSYRPAA